MAARATTTFILPPARGGSVRFVRYALLRRRLAHGYLLFVLPTPRRRSAVALHALSAAVTGWTAAGAIYFTIRWSAALPNQ